MFSIERYNNRYKISIGTGTTYPASNLWEIVYALQHYFQESITESPYDHQRHREHAKECGCCPLCRKKDGGK